MLNLHFIVYSTVSVLFLEFSIICLKFIIKSKTLNSSDSQYKAGLIFDIWSPFLLPKVSSCMISLKVERGGIVVEHQILNREFLGSIPQAALRFVLEQVTSTSYCLG